MSMTSHPSENFTHDYDTFEETHKGKTLTVLGQCFDSAGKRYEAFFCGEASAASFRSADAQANAAVEYAKMVDFLKAHEGHGLTHCGAVRGANGTADVWFCQTDKKFCFDDQT